MEKTITVSRKKAKQLTVSRKKAKIITVNRKSHYPTESLLYGGAEVWLIKTRPSATSE